MFPLNNLARKELTMGIVASQCPLPRDLVLVTRYLTPLISGCLIAVKAILTAINHVYNESADFIGSCAIDFDINGQPNLTEMVPVIGREGMVSHVHLRYTWDCLTQGICSLIEPAAMEKWVPFPAKSTQSYIFDGLIKDCGHSIAIPLEWPECFSKPLLCVCGLYAAGLKQEGIYRLSGQQSKVTQLLENFRQSEALKVQIIITL